MSNNTVFNRKKEYNAKIKKLVNEIKIACMEENIPFMCSFAIENSEEGTTYIHDGIPAAGQSITLKEDLFAKYLVAIRGGKFVPPSNLNLEADEDYINTLFATEEDAPVATASKEPSGVIDDGDLNFK